MRAVHFAATLSVAGVVLFNIFIAHPALRPPAGAELRAAIGRRLAWIGSIGLLLTLLSGAAWFVLVAELISDQPLASVLSDGSVLQSVLLDTDFGRDWLLRLLLIAILAGLLTAELRGKLDGRGFLKFSVVLAAAGLAGTLAWAGHGIGGAGLPGSIHLAADFLHLIAAAAWVGGLLPLAMMLTAARKASSFGVARAASLRFSAYGIAAVGTPLLTGAINTWYLAEQYPGIDRNRLWPSFVGQDRVVSRHGGARDGQSAAADTAARRSRGYARDARCLAPASS